LSAKHKQEWSDLSIRYQARKGYLCDQWKARIRNERKVFNAANKGLWKQYGRDKWRRKRDFDKLDSTFYGRLSLSIQAARLQRASGDPAFKDIGLAKLTWVNLQNARLRNATILSLEKQHLANFKDWYDRPLHQIENDCSAITIKWSGREDAGGTIGWPARREKRQVPRSKPQARSAGQKRGQDTVRTKSGCASQGSKPSSPSRAKGTTARREGESGGQGSGRSRETFAAG